ncbi:MAG: hypothetical protein DFNUSKGM_001612, partial [Candidatus Fervidibacter sacchari]
GAPIADWNGPNSQSWAWWWFYQPLLPISERGRFLFRLKVGLPFVSNAIPGYYEVWGMPYPRTSHLPSSASQAAQLFSQAKFIGLVEGWGR